MLVSINIRDIVLIEKLDLSLAEGLTVLTGETGAGKSILLDCLGLATGTRAERTLVRQGQDKGSVSAEFSLASDHPACQILEAEGLDGGDGTLILRRQITADGKSRAWVNDQSVSRGMLATLGDMLLEVHGQHDDRGLLEASAHRALLDSFGGHQEKIDRVSAAYDGLQAAKKALAQAEADLAAAEEDEEYVLHAQEELTALNPIAGEEAELGDQRALMMMGEKLSADLKSYYGDLTGRSGVDATVRGVLRRMERTEGPASSKLAPVVHALDRASIELSGGIEVLENLMRDLEFDPQDLDAVEERLFEIRRLARKHNCQPDQLSDVFTSIQQQATALSNGDAAVQDAKTHLATAVDRMTAAVAALSKLRAKSALRLDKLVTAELPPLKLEKAIFRTAIEPLEANKWNALGGERMVFEVKTNPSTPFGPMVKVAPGGELARFILALKVVLAEGGSVPVMVFDEVDRGVGGATASAVGERLKRLSENAQVLVVTHSPQVAARGRSQYQISKGDTGNITRTNIRQLEAGDRREEIARMLAGEEITEAARAAADQLLHVDEA
ncbi:MAG: DNA repair protein RecN [Kordiimonadaceae bacterium]|nr:DNA repair protein RecN [Kordiimonadaceae bacterium]